MIEENPCVKCGYRRWFIPALVAGILLSGCLSGFLAYALASREEAEVETGVDVPPGFNCTLRVEFKKHRAVATDSGDGWAWISVEKTNRLDVNVTLRVLEGEEWGYGNLTVWVQHKKKKGDEYTHFTTLYSELTDVTETATALNYELTVKKGYYRTWVSFELVEW